MGGNPLKIHPDAAVTVIIYRLIPDREVKASFAFRTGELRARSVAAITAEVKKQLTGRNKRPCRGVVCGREKKRGDQERANRRVVVPDL